MPTPCSSCGGTSGHCESCRGSWIRRTLCDIRHLFKRAPHRRKVIPIASMP